MDLRQNSRQPRWEREIDVDGGNAIFRIDGGTVWAYD
jgi:hypothetical protein